MDDRIFRARLHEINLSPHDQQQTMLVDLYLQRQHRCQIIACPMNIRPNLFNCFMFALGIHTDEHAQQVQEKRRLSLDFPPYLVQEGCITQLSRDQVQLGDLVYYLPFYDGEQLPNFARHAGIFSDSTGKMMVISKWGYHNRENIWLHQLDEVPTPYEDEDGGITTLFFRADSDKLKEHTKKVLHSERVDLARLGR